jgi:DNA-binding response OmpR family regulator
MAVAHGGVSGNQALRILLIEDDRAVSDLYRKGLTDRGYDVIVARDGEEGLELALGLLPDLVLLDVRLPRLTGLQVLQFLRTRPQTHNTPVVVLSNYDADELQRRGFELGALEWLLKVRTTPADLIAWVDAWAEEHTSARPHR